MSQVNSKKAIIVQGTKESRTKMATPPSKHGIHVGPSQLHLSGLMCVGVKRKRDDSVMEEKINGIQREEKIQEEGGEGTKREGGKA